MRAHRHAPDSDDTARACQDPPVPVDPEEVRIVESQLIELEELMIGTTPVYCRGVATASQIVSDGTGPLYRPRRRGDLRGRIAEVLAALRGSS